MKEPGGLNVTVDFVFFPLMIGLTERKGNVEIFVERQFEVLNRDKDPTM